MQDGIGKRMTRTGLDGCSDGDDFVTGCAAFVCLEFVCALDATQSRDYRSTVRQCAGLVESERLDTRQLTELRSTKVEERRKTQSLNANVYKQSERGYSSEAVITRDGVEVPVTVDVLLH